MKRIKEKIARILDTEIRNLLGGLTPEKRLAVALSLLGVMTLVFITVISCGIYRIGYDEALSQIPQIRSIAIPELIRQDTLPEHQLRYLDSIRHNRFNDIYDDTADE